MILLVEQDFTDVLGHGELAQGLTLTHPLAVVLDRVDLVGRSARSISSALSETFTGFGTTVGIAPR
jgi:hypothetical protein